MRTFGKKQTSPADSEGRASVPAEKSEGSDNWFRNNWRVLTLLVIVAVAFLIRFCFAYGISIGDNYALSGGTSAASHRRIIVEILYGTYNPGSEAALNYPYGAKSIYGPLFDYCCAAWAKLFSALGMSYDASAGAALAWNPPIFGAITCIPVFMLATKMFKGDKIIGLTAAAFYCLFPVLIMTTPFSYGTEMAFLCFLVVGLTTFVVFAFSAIDEMGITGIKEVFTTKAVVQWVILAALFMVFIVLTWTGFWAIMMTAAIMLFFALLLARLNGKPMGAVVGVASTVILAGVVAGACYYIPYGMWDSVFSGGCIVGALAVVYSMISLFLEKKPWVLSIPLTCGIILAVAVILYFAAPALSDAALSGNSVLTGTLMSALATETSRTSVSAMASYYGWLTLWFPLFFGVWMLYNYRKNVKSNVYTFTMIWLLACYCVGWYNTEYAVLAGAGFAVGSAALIITVFRTVDLKAYFRSLRGNGVKVGAKKALDFFPLVTVIVAVCLIAAPAAVYAADAATPSNTDEGYFGGLGYTVTTSDSSLINSAWAHSNEYATESKTLLSWYGYSDTASSAGGFSTVTSSAGGGTSAMASAFYATNGSEAIAALLIRLIESNPSAYQTALATALGDADSAAEFVQILSSESKAREYMSLNPEMFVGYNSSPVAESLPYIVGTKYLAHNFGEAVIANAYDAMCAETGNSINYIEVDAGMIPLYYGDGSYASSAAYFGDYKLDKYNSPSKFFSVSSNTEYYYQYGYYDRLYYDYTDDTYDTFFWNAVMGVTPDTYGLTSNISLLSALASSDGAVKATPAAGMGHFKVVYWHVNYKASENAAWEEKSINEALTLQNTNGGYINYLSSVVVLQYIPSAAATEITVTSGGAAAPNVKVAVFEKLKTTDIGYDPSGSVSYVQRYTTYTDDTGKCKVALPADYLLRYYVGSEHLRDGTIVLTQDTYSAAEIGTVTLSGKLVNSDGQDVVKSGCSLSFVSSSGNIVNAIVKEDATFDPVSLVPDKYTVNVYSADGTLLNSNTIFAVDTAAPVSMDITATTGTIEVAITDLFGEAKTGLGVTVTNSAGTVYSYDSAFLDANDNKIPVVVGTYTVDIAGAWMSAGAKTVTVSTGSSSAQKVEMTAYPATDKSADAGKYVMGLGYTDLLGATGRQPTNADAALQVYDASDAGLKTITGTVKDDGTGVQATLVFLNAGKALVFSTGTDGAFSVKVPTATYDLYVYTSDGKVCYEKGYEVSADGTKDLSVVSGNAVTFTVNYATMMSSSSRTIAYVPIALTVTIDTTDYAMTPVTGINGTVKVYVPTSAKIAYTVTSVSSDLNAKFNGLPWDDGTGTEKKTISSDTSVNLKFEGKETTGKPNVVATPTGDIDFKNSEDAALLDGQYFFDAYTGSADFYMRMTGGTATFFSDKEETASITVIVPGTYTVTATDGDVYVDSVSVNIYPTTDKVKIAVTEVFKIVFSTEEANNVSVVCISTDDTEGKIFDKKETASGTATYTYSVEKKAEYSYYVVITDAAGDNIFYSDVYSAAPGTDPAFTPELKAKKTLKGYVGSSIDGTILGTFGTKKFLIDVTGGEYSVALPVGDAAVNVSSMLLNASKEDGNYKYSTAVDFDLGAVTVGTDADTVKNFAVATTKAATGAMSIIAPTSMDCDAGTGSVPVHITEAGTYFVNGTNGFTLDKTGSKTLDAAGDIVVTGHFNAAAGAGNANLGVIVTKLGSDSSTTLTIPAEMYTGAGSTAIAAPATAGLLGSKVNDSVNGYAYKYVLAFKNDNNIAKTIQFDVAATLATLSAEDQEKWAVAVVDDTGYYVNAAGYSVNGNATTNLYVMLINKAGENLAAPGITVKFSGGDYTADVALSGPQTGSVSVDSASASGSGIDNTQAGVPTGFWILMVFVILLFLICIWGGMKRGVFSRRN